MLSYYTNEKLGYEIKKCFNASHAEKEHFHKELSIGIIEKGSATVVFDGVLYKLKERQLLIIPNDLVHKCIPTDLNNWVVRMLYLKPEKIKELYGYELNNTKLFYTTLSNEGFTELMDLFSILEKHDDLENQKSTLEKIIRKYLIANKNGFENIELKYLEKSKIAKVKTYIENNFNRLISLNELSTIAGFTKYHFLRSFKSAYKLSPVNYQKNLRFNNAKKLLKSKRQLTDVALDLGYYDQSHFSNDFVKFSGTTPKKYRKN